LVVLLLAAWVAIAHADEVAGDRKVAERHFRAGEKAYSAQNFEAAATNFEMAYKALPLPEIAFAVGQASRRQYRIDPKLEHATRAVEYYRRYLDKVKTGGKVGIAADSLGEMVREVEKLTAAGAKAAAAVVLVEKTQLAVSPIFGAEKRSRMNEIGEMAPSDQRITVTIDGKRVPAFQLVDVEPGNRVVRIEAEGYLPKESIERVVEGDSAVAEIPLDPKPARIAITTEAGARIRVGGKPVGPKFEVAAGKHLITIVRAGRRSVTREVEVVRGQELAIEQRLEKSARRRLVPFVLAGSAVLGVLTLGGVIYAAQLNGEANDHLAAIRGGDQPQSVLNAYNDAISNRDRVVTGTWITGGFALAVAAVAGALYLFDRPSEEGVHVTATASGAAVTFGGRF
jgi:hypothetical protein